MEFYAKHKNSFSNGIYYAQKPRFYKLPSLMHHCLTDHHRGGEHIRLILIPFLIQIQQQFYKWLCIFRLFSDGVENLCKFLSSYFYFVLETTKNFYFSTEN